MNTTTKCPICNDSNPGQCTPELNCLNVPKQLENEKHAMAVSSNFDYARFMAAHIGEYIITSDGTPDIITFASLLGYYSLGIKHILPRKPLLKITDEHARHFGFKDSNDFRRSPLSIEMTGRPGQFDYLRKNGYAVPFEHYTIGQQMEMGWIKLI